MNIGSQLPMDPMMTSMAMDFGSKVIQQQQQQVQGMVDKYISVGQLKASFTSLYPMIKILVKYFQYYFAVDNTYVTKKLALLLFPFTHSDWSVARAEMSFISQLENYFQVNSLQSRRASSAQV